MPDIFREMPDGTKIEYRRIPHPFALILEHRVLRPDGTPYPDGWYRVEDDHLLDLDYNARGILELLVQGEDDA